jgi:hypothetical protein
MAQILSNTQGYSMPMGMHQQVLGRYSKDRTYCMGSDIDEAWLSMHEVKLLDRQKYASVEDAVTALNRGQVPVSEFCIVYSFRRQAYYLLWPSDKSEADVMEIVALNRSGVSRNIAATTKLAATQVSTLKPSIKLQATNSVYNSQQSTADSTPENSDRDVAAPRQTISTNRPSAQPLQCLMSTSTRAEAETPPASRPSSNIIKPRAAVPQRANMSSKKPVSSPAAYPTKGVTSTASSSKKAPIAVAEATKPPSPRKQPAAVTPKADAPEGEGPVAMTVAFADATEMSVEELRLHSDAFDPFEPRTRSLLLDALGLASNSTIEPHQDNSGAFNHGVWNLFNKKSLGLVLKLVDCNRRRPEVATDTEKFIKLAGLCPNIVSEFSIAFPVKIFRLRGPSGKRTEDLMVMRRAAGQQLTQILYRKFHSNDLDGLQRIFKEFGSYLCTIHRVYRGMQHGDCQPSNVFYDRMNECFTLIDVADMGHGPFIAAGGDNDVEHFVTGLKTLSQYYSQEFLAGAESHFRQGYAEAKRRHSSHTS